MTGYAVHRLDEIDEITDGREPWRPVRHHFGITSFGVVAVTRPELPMLTYMLACCESKAGRTDAALEALRAAAVSRRMRMIAARDPDLDPIRAAPAFSEIIAPPAATPRPDR